MVVEEGVVVVERFVMVGQMEVFDGLCEGRRLWAPKGLSEWGRGLPCSVPMGWLSASKAKPTRVTLRLSRGFAPRAS